MALQVEIGVRFAVYATCVIATLPALARAQCVGGATSCLQCHEMRAEHPVLGQSQAWHHDHAFGDLCAACHRGQPDQAELAAAHEGMRDPLADPSGTCAPCHADDAAQRADRYAMSQLVVGLAAAPSEPPGPGTTAARAARPARRTLRRFAFPLAVRAAPGHGDARVRLQRGRRRRVRALPCA